MYFWNMNEFAHLRTCKIRLFSKQVSSRLTVVSFRNEKLKEAAGRASEQTA